MMPCIEYTVSEYLDTKQDLQAKCDTILLMISKLEDLQLDTISSAGSTISSYELDDGQVRIKTGYRSVSDIQGSIDMLEKRYQKYYNRLRGRTVVLQDKSTFKGYGCGF